MSDICREQPHCQGGLEVLLPDRTFRCNCCTMGLWTMWVLSRSGHVHHGRVPGDAEQS